MGIFNGAFKESKDRDIILTAIPHQKILYQLHFYFDKIAQKYGFISDNPLEDYQNFRRNLSNLQRMFRLPSEEERKGMRINYLFSDLFKKPVIVGIGFKSEDFQTLIQDLIKDAERGVHDVLARRAIERESEEVRNCFHLYACDRSFTSSLYYPDYQLYDLIKTIGVEKTHQFLGGQDKLFIQEKIEGFSMLRAMGYDIKKMEIDQLRKQVYEAQKLLRAKIFYYFQEREESKRGKRRGKYSGKLKIEEWLEMIGKKRARELFKEGKRMYWLAQQVWQAAFSRNKKEFYDQDVFFINWERFDLSQERIADDVIEDCLKKHKLLIGSLLVKDEEFYNKEKLPQAKPPSFALLIKVLRNGLNIRGIALALDKQRYLEGVMKGEVKDDFEFALADWPIELREAISEEEIKFYYQHADEYVLEDPNMLAKYALWRASEKGKKWNEIFKEVPREKSDLDFRFCLAAQTEEARNWYREAAEYVGSQVIQKYLLRFNAMRDVNERGFLNWHDVLLWLPYIKKLDQKEAKAILTSISTKDENREFINFLSRYDRKRDNLRSQGPILSLRELKKRVLAIESRIDLSKLPPQILDIISAPGLNLAMLQSMLERDDVKQLFEGKFDEAQPFVPCKRIYTSRPLTELVREALGSRKEGVRGKAKDPKGLFFQLQQLIKGREIEGRQMQVADLFKFVPSDLEQEIIALLQEQEVKISPIIEAQIHAKSDPQGWVCGNYTDCCMPFGDPKNDDYMFNPSTQYFTVKYNGRIVAQSVVVDARDKRTGEDVIILDNIEVAHNYKNLSPLIADAYLRFWTEYTSRPVKVGSKNSDLIPPGVTIEDNHYSPKTHLSYSDASGSKIYNLPKLHSIEAMDRLITFSNVTERDSTLIAQIERESYPESMVQGESYIREILEKQRELEVPGAASSFIIRQGGEAVGYVLILPEESKIRSGEMVAHIYDMAILPKFRNLALVKRMMERIIGAASAYGVSIEAETRLSTSYQLLMTPKVREWLEKKGFYLTNNEKLPAYLGGEDFYFVRLENRQNLQPIGAL